MEQKTSLAQTVKDYSVESIVATVKVQFSVLGPLGTAMDEIVFGIGERVRAKRFERFVEGLSERVNGIEEGMVDDDYLKSEDFYDLVVNIINTSVRTNSSLKHEILAKLFVKGILDKTKWEEGMEFTFVKYIDEMTDQHILIFKYLFENRERLENLGSFDNLFTEFCSEQGVDYLDKYEFRMYVRDLENKTLVRFSKNVSEYGSSGGYVEAESSSEVPGLTITSVGDNFSVYLTASAIER